MSDDTATKWQLYAALNPTVERIFPELAKEIGLNESIVLLQIAFWIQGSKYVHNGTYWTFHSLRDMRKNAFPFWSLATIRRIVHNLAESGYILIDNFNKREGDNTQWFALVPDKLSTLKSIIVVPMQAEGVYQNETPPLQDETPPYQNETTLHKTPNKSPEKKKNARARAGSTAKASERDNTTAYPKRLRDWNGHYLNRYYDEHAEPLDALFYAWYGRKTMTRWLDMNPAEKRLFIEAQRDLADIPAEQYPALVEYVRDIWEQAPLSELAARATEFKSYYAKVLAKKALQDELAQYPPPIPSSEPVTTASFAREIKEMYPDGFKRE